ncbi:MAG: nucleotidyltransferase family protein [Bryobacterales bacterium]|nr:nucleotidyltransferase family protein [Bryobacterales bacterium]
MAPWSGEIPDEQWAVYREVLRKARERQIPFALGGAFAVAAYTGQWRNSKDLDLCVLPRDRERMIEVITAGGLSDYFDQSPYDRSWIYRAYSGDTIVDVIWAMANHRADVDAAWIERASPVNIRGEICRVVPAEEMVWDKLYILQRDRCDWPDVLNLLFAVGPGLDWKYLLERTAADEPLLAAALWIFSWMCPGRAGLLPAWVLNRLRLPAPAPGSEAEAHPGRIRLLDTRPWFRAPAPEPAG